MELRLQWTSPWGVLSGVVAMRTSMQRWWTELSWPEPVKRERERERERKYVELLHANRCRLVVIRHGDWGSLEQRSSGFRGLTCLCPRQGSTSSVRRSVHLSWRRCCSQMLSVSCARALASLVALPASALPGTDGATPDLADLFTEWRRHPSVGQLWLCYHFFLSKKKRGTDACRANTTHRCFRRSAHCLRGHDGLVSWSCSANRSSVSIEHGEHRCKWRWSPCLMSHQQTHRISPNVIVQCWRSEKNSVQQHQEKFENLPEDL